MLPPINTLPSYFQLLEKTVKFGHHILADKIVYLDKLPVGNDDPFSLVPELYANLDRWLQVNLILRGKREAHYAAIIRPAINGRHLGWTNYPNLDSRQMKRNPTMFVDVPEPVQTPQFRSLVSLPVVVWLQRLDDGNGGIWDTLDGVRKLPPTITVVSSNDRESSAVVGGSALTASERSCQVIERATETGNKVPQSESHSVPDGLELELGNVLSSFKIILERERIWVALQILPDFSEQDIEVMLRPTNLQAGIVFRGIPRANDPIAHHF